MPESLVAYLIDSPAPGTLRIRLRNRPMFMVFVLSCAIIFALGVMLLQTLDSGELSRRAGGSPFMPLLMVLCVFIFVAAPPAGIWFWPLRETWLLARNEQHAWRITRNVLGKRRRVADEFSLEDLQGFCLRDTQRGAVECRIPVLIDRNGIEHWLFFETALLRRGAKRTEAVLGALAGFLQMRIPNPVDNARWPDVLRQAREGTLTADLGGTLPPGKSWPLGIQPRAGRKRRASEAAMKRTLAKAGVRSNEDHVPEDRSDGARPSDTRIWKPPAKKATARKALPPAHEDAMPAVSGIVRITLGVVGSILGLIALNNLFAILAGLFTGRFFASGVRGSYRSQLVIFTDTPIWFVVSMLVDTFGVLLLGGIAYGCLRQVLLAPSAERNRNAESSSAAASAGGKQRDDQAGRQG